MNAFISFLNSTVIERLFNRHTKKGLLQLVIALVLGYLGVSENFIENLLSYKWTFAEKFVKIHKIHLEILSLIVLLIAGFNIFRKEYGKIHLANLESQVKEKEFLLQIKKIEKELKNYEK